MNRQVLIAALLLCSMSLFAQRDLKESNFHLGVEFQTKYVWRGVEQMPVESAPVVFPQLTYKYKGFSSYVCGSYAINGKFSEIDLGVVYSYKWLTLGLVDYYYPTTESYADQYFNFKKRETGHCLEGFVNIAPENIPAYFLFSTFLAGEDYNLEDKQAYSTYGELGGHYDFLGGHQLGLAVGATFNKSYYNGYAHNFSICNIELKYTYNLMIKDFALPLSVAYIINPIVEKAHVNLSASFEL